MNTELTHFSLFSGIGGIDLAAEWAGFESVGQCEFAEYPTKILEKHWPEVARWKDIKDVTAKSIRDRIGDREITLLSGGFPCQPHSLAGLRLGSADERDLWDEFARVICEIKPRWVLGENVVGLLSSESGRYFGRILRDLAAMGYHAGWCVYPAAQVGTVHRRERVFIIAYAGSEFGQGIFNWCSDVVERGHKGAQKRSKDWFKLKMASGNIELLYDRHTESIKPLLTREDDGFSSAMDRNRCLGNAVVPHQVFPILHGIAQIEAANDNAANDNVPDIPNQEATG